LITIFILNLLTAMGDQRHNNKHSWILSLRRRAWWNLSTTPNIM